jgi:diadenosine tetraphosphate (Ap4A) HIT family hydrolase
MADGCGICRADRAQPPGGAIHNDGIWRVEHIAQPIPLLGWLVLAPARHVTTFADLSAGESAHFGPLAQAEGDLAPLGEVTALADRLRKALS